MTVHKKTARAFAALDAAIIARIKKTALQTRANTPTVVLWQKIIARKIRETLRRIGKLRG